MLRSLTSKVLESIYRIGSDPNDNAELRLQKIVGVFAVLMLTIPLDVIFGIIFILLNETSPGWTLIIGAILNSIGIATFSITRQFPLHNVYWCGLNIIIILAVDVFLGGYSKSGVFIVWVIISPMISLVLNKPWHGLVWLFFTIAALILSGILPNYLHTGNQLPPTLIIFLTIFNIAGCATLFMMVLYYFIVLNRNLVKELNLEQRKSENLLLNILPKEIANILKNENRTIADQYKDVSVLFADIVEFTPMSASMSPIELVELLNEVFMYFDELVEKYDLEKIKTIGDCYMVAAGVPRHRPDHAHVLAQMALDAQDYFSKQNFGERRLDIRVGINSGPVVAGVIGRKKFTYDLWGDVVNTASRMESHGVGGRIQITEKTYQLLKNDFICEPRGKVIVKGKGEMDVWHITGKRSGLSR